MTLVSVGVALLVLAGCGDDGEEGTGTTDQVTTTAPTSTGVDPALAAKVKRLIALARQSQFGTSQKQSIRIANAQAELIGIAQEHPEAIAPLIAALEKPDYELIADAYPFYIQLGRPGSERVLVEALNRQAYDDEGTAIALAFYSSGNKRLIAGAREWAASHGASFTGSPGGIGPKWGSTGLPPPEIPTAPPPTP